MPDDLIQAARAWARASNTKYGRAIHNVELISQGGNAYRLIEYVDGWGHSHGLTCLKSRVEMLEFLQVITVGAELIKGANNNVPYSQY